MAALSSLIPFPCNCNSLSLNSLPTLHSVAIIPLSGSGRKVEGSRRFPIAVQNRGLRSVWRIRAASEDRFETALAEEEMDEGEREKAAERPTEEPSEVEKLKKSLVDACKGTDRGLSASSETRAEILELIHQLEALNPTPAPTEAMTRLNGKWILAYTSFTMLFPLFSKGTLPWITVEEISQTIDSNLFTIQNSIMFHGLLASTCFTTNSKFEIRSPKRVQIKFEEGIIGTPQLTDAIVIPERVIVLGQEIELLAFRGLLTPLQYTAASVVSSLARTISSQSPLKIPFTNTDAQSWLLTTYLDDELRISRGEGGSVFLLIKEGSSLLSS